MIKLKSWLPVGSENPIQRTKEKLIKAMRKHESVIDLTIGEPEGAALLSARIKAAEAVMDDSSDMHGYQGSECRPVPDFAKRLIEGITDAKLPDVLGYAAVTGIKPTIGYIIQACKSREEILKIATMTSPGYPTPVIQAGYLGVGVHELSLNIENQFIAPVSEMDPRLIMLNYPHNPSGQIATKDYWHEVCAHCESTGKRLFNDAAYAHLMYDDSASLLSSVAPQYKRLSWVEAFSVSKMIGNGTGWRTGALVGSPDFVSDIRTIKANMEPGFFAPAAIGALYAVKHNQDEINAIGDIYKMRISTLSKIFKDNGMKLAISPKAGMFILCKKPKQAFSETIKSVEHFNNLCINAAGLSGIPFGDYIRYAVCTKDADRSDDIEKVFSNAKIIS